MTTRRRTRPEPIVHVAYESPCGTVRIERMVGEFYLFIGGSFHAVYQTCAAAEVAGLIALEEQAELALEARAAVLDSQAALGSARAA